MMNIYEQFNTHVKYLASTGVDQQTHALMGLIGEAGEIVDQVKKHVFYGKPLDTENILEEVGDLMFYLEWYLILHDLSLKTFKYRHWILEVKDVNISMQALSIASYANCVCTMALFSKNPQKYQKTLNSISHLLGCCKEILKKQGNTLEDALEYNINKLKKRYPEGFTQKHAIERLDKQ